MDKNQVQDLIKNYKQRKNQERFSSIGEFKEYIDDEWLDASTSDYNIKMAFPSEFNISPTLEKIRIFYKDQLKWLIDKTTLILENSEKDDPLDSYLLNKLLVIEESVLYLNDNSDLLFKSDKHYVINTSVLDLLRLSYNSQNKTHKFFKRINENHDKTQKQKHSKTFSK